MDIYELLKAKEKDIHTNHLLYVKKNGEYIKDYGVLLSFSIFSLLLMCIPFFIDISVRDHVIFECMLFSFLLIISLMTIYTNAFKRNFESPHKARGYIESCENITKNGADAEVLETYKYNNKNTDS